MPTKTLTVQVTLSGTDVTLKMSAASLKALLGAVAVPAPVLTPTPPPVPVPAPVVTPPAPAVTWATLGNEGSPFTLSAPAVVRYGLEPNWTPKYLPAGTYTASNDLFGSDPAPGSGKTVQARSTPPTAAESKPASVTVKPPSINWQSMPPVPAGSTDYLLPPGNYLNEDPSKNLLDLPYMGRRVIVLGTPGQPMRLRSAGHHFRGYKNRLIVKGAWLESMNPGVSGQAAGRAALLDQILQFEMYECLLDGTSGVLLGGLPEKGLSVWLGDPANGDRVRIERNRVRNIRGQYSDGTKDAADPLKIIPIRSNFSEIHGEALRWNPAVPVAERTAANKADPNKYGVTGFDAVQFVMLRTLPGLVDSRISDNLITHEYGKSRVEDNINLYAGSGGTEASRLLISGNFINGGQALDWNYRPGASMTYDGSNQVMTNAYGYQNPAETAYSGSGAIMDSACYSDLPGSYELNSAYVDWMDHTVIGTYASHQGGHHVRYSGVRVYEAVSTETGDPLKASRAGWQITNYGSGGTSRTRAGVVLPTWGNVSMDHCEYHGGDGTGGTLVGTGPNSDLLLNGGSYDASNRRFPRAVPGFEPQLLSDWQAAKTTAGLNIGLPS